MLKRKFRFNVGKFKSKFSIGTIFFILKVGPNERKESRFGVLVSGKIEKKAVVRNRIKRQLQSCIGNLLEKIKPGFDFLFIVKKEALDKKTEEICQEIEKQLKKGGLFK